MANAPHRITVLLADDDALVRSYVRRLLAEEGCEVIEAGDGADALEAAAAFEGQIHLLVTDIIMPKVNGLVLAERLSQTRPEIRVVYMSGYVESNLIAEKIPGLAVLRKPFTAEQIRASVRNALTHSPT